MDILLINPYNETGCGINEATVEVPVGLLSLAATLEKRKINVSILDAYAMQLPEYKVIDTIKSLRPNIVGIYVNIFSFLQAISYTEKIKKISKDIIVIWGGPHPTVVTESCFKKSKVDFVVIGEGESTLLEFMENRMNKSNLAHIKGLAYRQGSHFKINSPRERIVDLDSLPLPAYHLLPDMRYYKTRARKRPFMGIITSRGCPFNCIYCSKDVFKSRITMRSPENIMEEIDLLVNRYKVRQIDILDDNFAVDRRRVERLCDLLIERNYKICINLQLGIRADKVDEGLLRKMRRAGVFKLAFGVETGNELVLREIKKQLDLDEVLEASYLARKCGIIVVGYFMIGLPGDNEQTLQETIDFAIKMNPHIANFMMTIPFYGTELYRRIERDGKFLFDTKEGISHGFYSTEAYYELGNLTKDLMIKYYKKAYREFYFRFTKALDMLCSVRSFAEFKWIVETGLNTLFPKSKYK